MAADHSITTQDSKRISALLIVIVGIGVLVSFLLDWQQTQVTMKASARERGSALFTLVELTRSWNALHGGVYVPITENTQPNPYLEHPRRDLTSTDGLALTMINPAFMTRQLAELAEQSNGVQLHITSRKPIRPDNKPDAWEAAALDRFENGLAEIIELIPGSPPVHRYMAPLKVKEPCMKCHARQGYEIGQVRGGISVTMPADNLLALRNTERLRSAIGHFLVFAVIAALLHLLITRTRNHLEILKRVNQEQEQVIEERTRSLTLANALLEREVAEREVAAAVFDNVAEGIMVVDYSGHIQQVNPAFLRLSGYAEGEVIGRDVSFLSSDHHPPEFLEDLKRTLKREHRWQGEIWNRRKNGENFVSWLSITPVSSVDQSSSYVATLSDITLRKELEDQLRHLAYHDPLTDLPNRALFRDRLQVALSHAQRHKHSLALCFIDLDHFKAVNDTLGHGAGDQLLVETAARLRACVRSSDSLARLGGDEFAAILTDMNSVDEVREVAARMVLELARPFELTVGIGRVTASIGVAIYPQHGTNYEALQFNADAALYRVKKAGRNAFRISEDV